MSRAVSAAWGMVLLLVAASPTAMSWSASEVIDAETHAFAEARQAIDQVEDAEKRDRMLRDLARAQAEAGDESAAQTALAISDAQDRYWRLDDVAEAQVAAGQLALAMKTAQAIDDPDERDRTYHTIAYQQGLGGDFEGAIRTIDRIQSEVSRARAVAAFAKTQVLAGDIDAAMETLADRQGVTPGGEALVYEAIAQAHAEVGDLAAASTTAQAMRRIMDRAPDEKSRSDIAERVVVALTSAGHIEEALELAESLPEGWSKRRSLTTCAKAQARAGDVEAAVATAQRIDGQYSAYDALRDIALTRLEDGHADGAVSVIMTIPDLMVRTRDLQIIAQRQAEAGDIDGALATVDRIGRGAMLLSRLGPALADIAVAQAQAGRPEDAGNIFYLANQFVNDIRPPYSRATEIGYLVETLAKASDPAEAGEVAEAQTIAEERAEAYIGLARGLHRRMNLATPIPFPVSGPSLESAPGKMNLHEFTDLDTGEQLGVVREKLRAVFALLQAPDVQGRPKPAALRESHLKAYELLQAYFTKPREDNEIAPQLQFLMAMQSVHREQDAYADVDRVVLALVDRLQLQLAQAARDAPPSDRPSR